MASIFKQNSFAQAIKARRDANAKGLREVADEIGDISASTLSRIENGKTPDLTDFLAICAWLRKEPSDFWESEVPSPYSTREQVQLILAQDGRISHEIIMAIDAIVKLAIEGKDG